MICGFLKPDLGEVIYDEYKLGNDYFKSISYLPEIDKININLTVYEYLEFYCNLYGISRVDTENRITELLDFVELFDLKDRSVSRLSKYEVIKLSLARCLVNVPKVILIDEPFNRLDMTSRSSIKNLIGDLNISGITFVIVSHLLSEISDFCSDIVILSNSKVGISGSTEYCLDMLNRNNPLKIEVLDRDVDLTYKTLTSSTIVNRVVKNKNKFYIYFNENDDKNIMQSRLLSMLVGQGIIPTLFAKETKNNIDISSVYNIDGIVVGSASKIIGAREYTKGSNLDLINQPLLGILNGEITDQGRTLETTGISYGPYISLGVGTYHVEWVGDNLNDCMFDVCAGKGTNIIDVSNLRIGDERADLDFTIDHAYEDIEIRCINNGKGQALITHLYLQNQR